MQQLGQIDHSKYIVVFIHGGSWRSGTPLEYKDVGQSICNTFGNCVIPEYSLCTTSTTSTTGIKWGPQIREIQEVLESLYTKYKKSIVLFGHSCGAQMAMIIEAIQNGYCAHDYHGVLFKKYLFEIDHIYGISGIYDIPDMLIEYPSYIDFVVQCFGTKDDLLKESSPTQFTRYLDPTKITIIHSTEDDLLSTKQSNDIATKLNSEPIWISGKHWECLRSKAFLDVIQGIVNK